MAQRSLQDFVEDVSGEGRLRVEKDFGGGFVRLRTSEAERRQAAQDIQCSENIIIELLRNARDAHASHIFVATCRDGDKRTITVVDDGDGIPANMHEHVFEPRVTSKLDTSHKDNWGLHGRGMALYSISENTESAYIVSSDVNLGCSIRVVSDVTTLQEKADQSSFPRFMLGEGGRVDVRGPRNILRTSCEFAIEERDSCSVFIGSPAEIAAAIYSFGGATLSAIDRAFCKDESRLPLVKRLATASDPRDLARIAASIGLDVSERTARRIMDGQIDGPVSLIDMVVISDPRTKTVGKPSRSTRATARVKVSKADRAEFADEVIRAYAQLAQRYYLAADVDPSITVMSDKLIVTIPIVREQ